ncbi:assembly factor cbp4 [Pichia californica]|uniref:Cytochrome b mRNA-processing protein 4 n=1 Tax=Pichia californica TaxID=460514 RepID=A0A9P6WIJ0_9ASCO|nr:assembly factor cbp4 [[Candida] californica]
MSSPTMIMLKHTALWGGGIIGLGVILYNFTVPTDEELLSRMSPEIRADVEKHRELRQQEQKVLMDIAKKTAASDKPIWQTGELYNPWEGTGNKLLIDKINFEKEQAENKLKNELEALKEQQKKLK